MPLRKLFVIQLILAIALHAAAQAPKITYSEPEREDSRRTNFDIVGKLNGNFLVYKSNRSDNAICIYDSDMKLKQRVKLGFVPEQLINVDFIAYPDFFYMIYQFQKRNIVHCMAAKLDGNAKSLMEPVELDTTQIGWAASNKIYTTVNSDDRQRIMVFKINSRNQKSFIFSTRLYDAGLQLLASNRMNMPMEERNDFFTDFVLSNDGELVFGKFMRQNSNEYITRYAQVIKYPDSSAFSITNVDIGGRILDEIKLKADNTNKRVLVNAFYYKQKRGNIEGLYSLTWDIKQNKKIKELASVFNDELRSNARGSDEGIRTAFNDYFIKNVMVRKDGGYIVISEAEYSSSRGNAFNRWDYLGWNNPWMYPAYNYWSPLYSPWYSPWNRWGGPSVTRFYAENIMVLSYSKDGNIEWSNIIPKSQYDDETNNMVSFQVMNTSSEIHFLFNVFERRVLMLNDQSIDADGKVSRNPTLKNLDKGYEFMPRYGRQVAGRQMIVPCLYRNYLCFAKIDY